MTGEEYLVQEKAEAADQEQHRKYKQKGDQGIEPQFEDIIGQQGNDDSAHHDHAAGSKHICPVNHVHPAVQYGQFMLKCGGQAGLGMQPAFQQARAIDDACQPII